MVEKEVINTVVRYLGRVSSEGIPAVAGVIYGSFARGENSPESDIDLLVLSPAFDGRKDYEQAETLWEVTYDVDYRIEPIPVGVREFAERQDSPIIAIARREGIVVQAPGAAATVATG